MSLCLHILVWPSMIGSISIILVCLFKKIREGTIWSSDIFIFPSQQVLVFVMDYISRKGVWGKESD